MELEHTINGKKVVFKKRILVEEAEDLLELTEQASTDKGARYTLLSIVVDTWEFDGDPHNVDSYRKLDMFDEFLPLVNAMSEYVAMRLRGINAKN